MSSPLSLERQVNIQGEQPLCHFFEKIINKKVNQVALNVFERLIDTLCLYFYASYQQRLDYCLSELDVDGDKAKWQQNLIGKRITHHFVEQSTLESLDTPIDMPIFSPASSPISSPSPLKKQAQERLNQICQKYIQDHQLILKRSCISRNLDALLLEFEDRKGLHSFIEPDQNLACLLLPFLDEQSKVFFAPAECNPSTEKGFDFLENILSTAFACGKEFVIVRLDNSKHAVVAAFQSNGEFKIIDSLLNHTVDLPSLVKKLNQVQLKNEAGEILSFKGKYINTHLQKGGNECLRFATLYGYQMAKKQSLEAYQEVNGAFAAGRLNTFEDIAHIDGADFIRDASQIPRKNYQSFMHSWAYRSLNLKVNDWKELTLADLRSKEPSDPNTRDIYVLSSSDFIIAYPTYDDDFSELERSSCPYPLPLSAGWEETRLASLIPQGEEKVVIIADPNKDPLIFCAAKE